MIVGISGTICSGKSTFCAYLKEKGFEIVDADKITHLLYVKDSEIYPLIKQKYPSVICEQGEIDRRLLAKIIFNQPSEKVWLEHLMHPLILKKMQEASAILKQAVIFWDVPLLFEAHFDQYVDKSICVVASDEVIRERLIKRNNFNDEEIEARLRNQMSSQKKSSLADYVIENNHDLKMFKQKIDDLLKALEILV